MPLAAGGQGSEDQTRDPDADADEELAAAYRRKPLDPEFLRSAARLAALAAPEW